MLLNGLRTLLVVLGLQGNGQDRDSDIGHHEGPALSEHQALQYEHNSVTKISKGTTTNLQYRDLVPVSAPRGAFECSPDKRTRYKLVSKEGQRGKKFICPVGDIISSCRCPQTLVNGTKVNRFTEVPHDNYRVCSCRDFTCGNNCRKIVTRAVCCGEYKRCPINKSQKPRHRKDWICRIDVRRSFGINPKQVSMPALNAALEIAMAYLRHQPKEMVELYFRTGVYNIDGGDKPAILLKHFKPVNNGRLIIAGQGMDRTTLNFIDWRGDMIAGNNVSKVTVRDLHLTRSTPGAMQGFVTEVRKGEIVLDIPKGFPTPAEVHNGHETDATRAYLRRFTNISSPQVVMEDNIQLPWTGAYRVNSDNDRVWAFRLKSTDLTPNYNPGDLVGIKSKCCGSPTSCSYFFRESREIMFERVRWTRQSRGVFRLSTNDVTIKDCEIVREPPINGLGWCLSTSDGGPQFGQPNDSHVHKVRVENFYAENTGDDALAFFNVKTAASIDKAVIRDSFARSILLYRSPDVVIDGVKVENAPICVNDNLEDIRKIYDIDEPTRLFSRTFQNLLDLLVPNTRLPPNQISQSFVSWGTRVNDPFFLKNSNCTIPQ